MPNTERAAPNAGRSVDGLEAAFLAGVLGWGGWYLHDAWQASPTVANLLLIAPASVLMFVLGLVLLPQIFVRKTAAPRRDRVPLRITGSMALLGLYVLLLGRIGFDVATFLYVAASLLLLGERRPFLVILLSLGFALAVTWSLARLASVPIPTLIGT